MNTIKIKKLSPAQNRKLKKGGKVIIKPGDGQEINLDDKLFKKFNRKSKTGSGLTIQQKDIISGGMCCANCGGVMESEGGSIIGKIKKAKLGKKIIKFAKDNKILKRVGNALVERAISTIAGAGVEEMVEPVKRKRGRPKKSGGALFPAGGALLPAGINKNK